jgi:hypothetical protein
MEVDCASTKPEVTFYPQGSSTPSSTSVASGKWNNLITTHQLLLWYSAVFATVHDEFETQVSCARRQKLSRDIVQFLFDGYLCFDSVISFSNVYLRSRDSSVDIVTAYCLDGRGIWVLFLGEARDYFLDSVHIGCGADPVGTRGTFAEGQAGHSLPSRAEDKKDGVISPFPHTSSWRGTSLIKHKDNCTFQRTS